MNYRTFSILIVDGEFSRYIEIIAISIEAAKADIAEAFGNVYVLTWQEK